MSEGDISATNQAAGTEDLKESVVQECSPTNDATADELFESFMEIANDPTLQHSDQMDRPLGQSDIVEPSHHAIHNGTIGQSDLEDSQSCAQVLETEKLIAEEAGSFNPDSQLKDTDTNGTNEKASSPTGVGLVKGDSSELVTLGDKPTSDEDPLHETGLPMGSPELGTSISSSVMDEGKPGEVCVTTSDDLLTASSVTPNKDEVTEGQSCEIELLQKSSGDNVSADLEDQGTGSHTVLSDNKELFTERSSSPNDSDPDASKTEVAKRLSKAVEDLAGLEQLLSNAVSEFKVPISEKKVDEDNEGKDGNTGECVSQLTEDKNKELGPGGVVADVQEKSKVEGDEAVSQDSEVVVDGRSDVPVFETGKEEAVCEAGAATDLLDAGSPDDNLNNNGTLGSSDELSAEVTASESKGAEETKNTAVILEGEKQDTSELEDAKMERSVESLETAKQATQGNKDSQIEDNVLEAGQPSDAQESASLEGSKMQTSSGESPREILSEEFKNDAEAAVEKSDSASELDNEVANASVAVGPDIEVTMTDESGISERKSLDSLDTEESSNSRPTSPAVSDEGIDSDVPSDYGDDDEEVTFEPENLNSSSSPRKSWLLETDRGRLSSDSSTVSEKDFKEKYAKGDNADGKTLEKDYIRGHLLKMGGTGLTPKNWRKRWFVLRSDNCLYYYKSSKDKVPCGVIILSNYSVSKAPEINKNHCFKLTKGGARTYYMCAGSDLDMKKWMVSVMDAVKQSAKESNPFNILESNVHNVSIPALSIRDPDCHGYLYKQGSNYKIWRRRYFVLKHGFLYYYTDMSNTVALGVAKLLDYTINTGEQSGKKFCFSAVSSDQSSRSYHFAAESAMDRTRWLSRLEDSIKKGSSRH